MSLGESVAIFAAGLGAGVINAVAGGGTLLSFPVLLWAGRDPIVANATNALALWPGSMAGAYGFRRELVGAKRLLRLLLPAAVVGGVAGAALLLRTPSEVFAAQVPVLILAATLLVALQRPLSRLLGLDSPRPESRWRAVGLVVAQVVVSIYGGYFGAGMGILMLAALGLYGIADIHQRNGLKNLLAAVINGAATVAFVSAGAILWGDAALLGAGAILGGYVGASIGRRLPRKVAEILVVCIGLGMTTVMLLR